MQTNFNKSKIVKKIILHNNHYNLRTITVINYITKQRKYISKKTQANYINIYRL